MKKPQQHLQNKQKAKAWWNWQSALWCCCSVLGGVIDLGRMFFAYIAIRDAAQEGAIYASITETKTTADILNRIHISSDSPVDMAAVPDYDIEISVNDGSIDVADACAGDLINITVTYYHQFIMPLTTTIVGNKPLPLKAEIHYVILTPICY